MGLRDKALEKRKVAQQPVRIEVSQITPPTPPPALQAVQAAPQQVGLRGKVIEKIGEIKKESRVTPDAEKILGLLHYRIGSIGFGEAAKKLKTTKKQVEEWATALEDDGLVEIEEHKISDSKILITDDALARILEIEKKKPREERIIVKPKPTAAEKPKEEVKPDAGEAAVPAEKPPPLPRDKILGLLDHKEGKITLAEAAKKLKASDSEVRKWAHELSESGFVEIRKKSFGEEEVSITKKNLKKVRRLRGIHGAEREADVILDAVPEKGKAKLDEIARAKGLSKEKADKYASELAKDELVEVGRQFIFLGGKTVSPTKKLARIRANLSLISQLRKEDAERDLQNDIERINTTIDDFARLLSAKKDIDIDELALTLKIDQEELEEWTNLLSSNVKINYPVNIAAKPRVLLSKDFPDELPPIRGSGQVLDDYRITADMVPARIRVYDSKEESMPLYIIGVPKPGRATDLMVKALADKLTDRITIDVEEITDPKKMLKLKDRFYAESKQLIDEEIPASEKDKEVLAGMLLHNTYGLGDVEILMNDDWLEELGINTANVPITAYHKKYGWTKTSILLGDEKVVYNYATQIGRKIGRNITALDPIMDAHLLTGDRVCATLFPISSLGNTITIRKFARSPWTLIHFISPKFYTLSKEIAAFLWLCFQYELNVMVGGGTASGKTSMLSSLCSLIQPTQRVITIEDTREINLPKNLYWNWIPLTTRQPNPEGKGEVSMLDLIITSLRMRPDRIILGEIRRRREAEVLFEAMHTGHSVYGTIHADTARNLKRRLIEPPIEIPAAEVEALHLILIQYRDRKVGKRKTFEVAEIVPATEGREFQLNYLYRWNSREQKFVKINESTRIFNDLNLHTGMNRDEINKNLKEKEEVLQWMLDNKIENIDEVGKVLEEYYKDDKRVLEIARRNGKFEEL